MASVLQRTATRAATTRKGYAFALWAFWAFIIVAVARLGEILPGLSAVPLGKIAVGACMVGVLFRRDVLSPQPLLNQPLPRTALALFLLSGFSVVFSVWMSATTIFFFGSALIVAIGFLLTLKLFNSRRALIVTLGVLVLTGLAQATAAFVSDATRVSAGSSYDTNDLAYLLVTVLPVAIAFIVRATTIRTRVIWVGATGLLLLVIMLTQSRGGFLGLLGVAGCLIVRPIAAPARALPVRLLKVGKPRKPKSRLLTRLTIVSLSAVVVWAALPSEAKSRLLTVFSLESDYNTDVTLQSGRLAIWERSVKAVIARPIGFGLNAFGVVDGRTGGKFKAAHNSLVQVLVELGFLGLFLFLRVYWLAWRTLGSPRPDDRDAVIFCHALRTALVGNFISGFFLSQAYSNLLWTLFAVIVLCGFQFCVMAAPPAPTGRRGHA